MNLSKRQQILGQYVAQLFADGVIKKEAQFVEITRLVSVAFSRDIQALLGFVVRQKTASAVDQLAKVIRDAVAG